MQITEEIKKVEYVVNAIQNGTVIDRIAPKSLFKAISILGLDESDEQITFGNNLDSKVLKKKAVIKISGKFFDNAEINKIALVAPEARLNIIRDYKVVEKREVTIPNQIDGIIKCLNPKCITNNETITTKFFVISRKPLTLKCHYCERAVKQESVNIL
jgi:aspartate carbamoyltransferase regulatory subunit